MAEGVAVKYEWTNTANNTTGSRVNVNYVSSMKRNKYAGMSRRNESIEEEEGEEDDDDGFENFYGNEDDNVDNDNDDDDDDDDDDDGDLLREVLRRFEHRTTKQEEEEEEEEEENSLDYHDGNAAAMTGRTAPSIAMSKQQGGGEGYGREATFQRSNDKQRGSPLSSVSLAQDPPPPSSFSFPHFHGHENEHRQKFPSSLTSFLEKKEIPQDHKRHHYEHEETDIDDGHDDEHEHDDDSVESYNDDDDDDSNDNNDSSSDSHDDNRGGGWKIRRNRTRRRSSGSRTMGGNKFVQAYKKTTLKHHQQRDEEVTVRGGTGQNNNNISHNERQQQQQRQDEQLQIEIRKLHLRHHANNPMEIIRTLQYACLTNNTSLLQLILSQDNDGGGGGCGISFVLRHGMILDPTTKRTLLWMCCYVDSHDFMRVLIKECLNYYRSVYSHDTNVCNDRNNGICAKENQDMEMKDDDSSDEDEEEKARTMVRKLLEMETRWGSKPILIAAAMNHPKSITTLLRYGANPNATNSYATSGAILAASKNNVDALRALGRDRRTDFNAFNDAHVNPVLLASQNGNVEALRYLYEYRRGMDHSVDFTVCDGSGYGCVALAALHNQPNVISYFSEKHDPRGNKPPNINQRFLRDNYEEVDERRSDRPMHGDTPLHIAARCGNVEALDALLCSPACDIPARNLHGMTALHVAVRANRVGAVRLFVTLPKKEFDSLDVTSDTGMTPLYAACYLGHAGIVEILAPVSDTAVMCHEVDGKTYLGAIGEEEAAGGTSTRAASIARPPLLAAVANDHVEATTALLACGATDVNQTDEAGHTAISIAARMGFYRMCQVLMMHRADLTIRSKKGGGTPVQKAKKYKHRKIVELLEKYGGS